MVYTIKGVTYDDQGKVVDCIFCRISKKIEPATIVFEDDCFVVFKTTSPATFLHLLVSPREHIQNAAMMSGPNDAKLVRRMIEVGKIALGEFSADAHFCFHIAPFNSIDHLHMHAIAKADTMSFLNYLKYNTYLPNCRSADSIIDSCMRGKDRE
jgi:diadenosine tetraphosphate (Ap4A) HIT family hydrolase